MKLFLLAYANAAIVVPALWIGARPLDAAPLQTIGALHCKCADHCIPRRKAGPQIEGSRTRPD
jgi:hypothetical protein